MRIRFLLTLAASFGMLLLAASGANAQAVTVNANFQLHMPTRPDTTQPSGSAVAPADPKQPPWQVICDYGTFPNGNWQLWAQGPTPVTTPVAIPQNGGPVNWQQPGVVTIINPPPNLYVRARLQKQTAPNTWMTMATTYNTVP
jgi:hypothetical protein